MSNIDSVGPFGNPDGARADIADLLEDFVDLGENPAFGALGTSASDARVRIVAGKLGAGKTVHLRRLQEYQGRQDSVYAVAPQQGALSTEDVIRVCQWFSGSLLEEKWTLLWNRAILRSLSSHLLRSDDLSGHVSAEDADDLQSNYGRLLGEYRRPRPVYGELRDIVNEVNTGHQLNKYLNDPLWDDLEGLVGDVMRSCPPVFFYIDGVDENFSAAPMYWMQCQKGLFQQVMRLLREPRLGGLLHVVVTIRDVVISSIFRSEHAPRFIGEPHIRLLTWDHDSMQYLLASKLEHLDDQFFVGDVSQGKSVEAWLGSSVIRNDRRGIDEDMVNYLLRHTRPIPRDLVSLGNALCLEALKAKSEGKSAIPPSRLRESVAQSARRFGDSQLAQCTNQIASDTMPGDAARHGYADVYTGPQAYTSHILDALRSIIAEVGVDRFGQEKLTKLRESADRAWECSTDLPSVLWQNGLLGYIDRAEKAVFYSLGRADQFTLPDRGRSFVFHPCVIDSAGIASVDSDPIVPF